MLEDILKSVNKAEAEADEILKTAEVQVVSILEEAKSRAKDMKVDTYQKIKLMNQEITGTMQSEGQSQLAAAAAEAGKETEALRELIAPKRAEAVEAVISSLV